MQRDQELKDLPLVYVDTNHYWLSPSEPAIGTSVATEMNLEPGQLVIAYAPYEDAWTGIVRHDLTLEDWCAWWVELGQDVDYDSYVEPRVPEKWKGPYPGKAYWDSQSQ